MIDTVTKCDGAGSARTAIGANIKNISAQNVRRVTIEVAPHPSHIGEEQEFLYIGQDALISLNNRISYR